MNHKGWHWLNVIVLSALLTACPGGGPTPPAAATVNGVTSIDRQKGSAELSVSALDAAGNVLESGTISGVSATVTQAGFTAQGDVCEEGGEISSLGPVVAALTFDATPSLTDNCSGSACPPVPNDPFDVNGDTVRRRGGLDFVERMKSNAQAAVSYFNSAVNFVNLQRFTTDKALLEQAVMSATSPAAIGGGTPLWSASLSTINLLDSVSGNNRIAVIFTDGGDTTFDNPNNVETAAISAGVRVFYIGLGNSTNVAAMLDIAEATEPDGLYVSAKDRSELLRAFEGVINGSQGAGCIGVVFTPVPISGTNLSGELSFKVNGARFTGAYSVTF
jgi:hypothetical protein